MRHTTKRWAAAAVLALAATACAGAPDTGFPPAGFTPSPTPTATGSPAATAMVDVGDNFFEPQKLTIQAGVTVVWEHIGNAPHTVTADDGSWDSSPGCPEDISKCMQNGDTFRQAFEVPGEVPYYCKIHGAPGGIGQAGTITVEV